jgi:hypothetical protein
MNASAVTAIAALTGAAIGGWRPGGRARATNDAMPVRPGCGRALTVAPSSCRRRCNDDARIGNGRIQSLRRCSGAISSIAARNALVRPLDSRPNPDISLTTCQPAGLSMYPTFDRGVLKPTVGATWRRAVLTGDNYA